MSIPLVPELLRSHLSKLAETDMRIDGRSRFESRETTLETGILGNAEGSARVQMGNTIVLAGVKFQLMTPYPDRPTQGGLMCSAEVRPVAGRGWEAGPPSAESIELGRVVDRGIRESGCIDVDELCIIPGERAWQVILDLFAVSDDGNLFDAFALAGIAALRTAIVPAERFEIGEDYPLPVSKTPIMCSYHKVGGRYVLDADKREETGGDERIHITLGDDGHVHSLQKGLKGIFSAAEFDEIMEHALTRCAELRELVDNATRSDHMAKRTQKAGASAKYGPRYGVSVRRRAASVLKKRSRKFTCPSCQYQKVSRTVAGIWECSKCGHKFTGGYWEPFTRATEANNRIIRRGKEGATSTDLAVIAQQAALDYERRVAEGEVNAGDEEE